MDGTKNSLLYCIAGLFVVAILSAVAMSFAPGDHSTTIALIIGMATTGAGFLIQHFKTKEAAEKLERMVDENTELTYQVKDEAKEAAETAAIKSSDSVVAAVNKASKAAEEQKQAATELREAINGRMQQLLDAKYAEGVVAGQEAMRLLEEQQRRHHERDEENLKVLRAELKKLKEQMGLPDDDARSGMH